ncbi:MAG TPA: IclR family transcriptional regulator C-terminal domain-containing protein [Candidatus Dormibacteraeota bacterium]|nr:IclR family transcriptional regulator C-terminal domain-containing protein [Candidatus Dormibacteraeota bacterium]
MTARVPPDRDFVQSLGRGLAVIQAFTDQQPALSIARVAERTRLSRAACRRFLVTLERLGYVVRDEAGRYRLLPAVLRLGYAYLSSQELPQIVRPHCDRLAKTLHVSSSLGVLDGTDIVFLYRALPRGYLHTRLGVGSRLPAHSTAMGRAILAEMSDAELDAHLERAETVAYTPFTATETATIKTRIKQVRELGYSLLDQEIDLGVRALALPLRYRSGKIAGSICLGLYDPRIEPATVVRDYLRPLRQAAAEINSTLALLPS